MLARQSAWPHFQHLQDRDKLRAELEDFIKDMRLQPKVMPSAPTLRKTNRQDLLNAILQAGESHGFFQIATRLTRDYSLF
jgi:hypothetical protein